MLVVCDIANIAMEATIFVDHENDGLPRAVIFPSLRSYEANDEEPSTVSTAGSQRIMDLGLPEDSKASSFAGESSFGGWCAASLELEPRKPALLQSHPFRRTMGTPQGLVWTMTILDGCVFFSKKWGYPSPNHPLKIFGYFPF